MIAFVKKLFSNDKIRYIFAGGCTTLVNFVVFFLLRAFTSIDRNVSNTIAIICAIIFAYFINKLFVFESHVDSAYKLISEMVSFAGARILSMVIEVIGFAILCDSFRFNEFMSKLAVQVVVLVLNYVFSKVFVFTERKKGFKELISENWSYLLAALITAVFMLVCMIIGKVQPFGTNSYNMVDSMHQYLPFFADYRDKLLNEGSLFYTWNIGLGSNFMSLLLYYMGSPINLIVILFKKTSIPGVMSWLIAFKIAFSSGAFGYFLSRRKENIQSNLLITAFAVAFGLNNFMLGYMWNIMWLDCIMVLPLIVLGFEKMMKDEGCKLYVLSLFYCLYCNYYIAFIICIFLTLWFLAYRFESFYEFCRDFLKFAGYSVLSAGLAAFSLLTAYSAIMKTASAGKEIPEFSFYGNIFEILKQHLMLAKPIKNQNFDGGANLYCGIFVIILLFVYLMSDRIALSDKIKRCILLIFLALSMNEQLLNFVWHGFHDQYGIPNRFAFVYIFVLLLIGYEAASKLRNMHPAYIISSAFLAIAFVLLCKYEVSIKTARLDDTGMLFLNIAMLVAYAISFILRATKALNKKTTEIIIASIIMGEILVNGAFAMNTIGNANAGYYVAEADEMDAAVAYVKDYSEEMGYTLYREDMHNPRMLDEATFNGMKSMGTFCSTVIGDTVTAMGRLGFYTGANEYLYDGATAFTSSLIGVRYVYARTDDFVPESNNLFKIYDEEGVQVYENPYALPIAYAVTNDIWDYELEPGRKANIQNEIARIFTNSYDKLFHQVHVDLDVTGYGCYANVREDNMSLIDYLSDIDEKIQIGNSFEVPYDGEYYFYVNANSIDKIQITINGDVMSTDRYQLQMGRLGLLSTGDMVDIQVNFNSDYSKEGTMDLFVYVLDQEVFQDVYAEMSKYPLNVTEYKDGYVKGEITLDSDMTLMTSIPYDEGWTLYVDGVKTEYEKTTFSFIGAKLTAGTHEIKLSYFPGGLLLGIIVSLISVAVFIVIIMTGFDKRKPKNDNESDDKTDAVAEETGESTDDNQKSGEIDN